MQQIISNISYHYNSKNYLMIFFFLTILEKKLFIQIFITFYSSKQIIYVKLIQKYHFSHLLNICFV